MVKMYIFTFYVRLLAIYSLWYKPMGSALFWDITRSGMVILYRRFGTTFLTLEYRTDTLSRNVGTELPLNAA
jgi:hypothetical protein